MSVLQNIASHLLDGDLTRLKRLGDRRAILLRELQRIELEINETSTNIGELHNACYAGSILWKNQGVKYETN